VRCTVDQGIAALQVVARCGWHFGCCDCSTRSVPAGIALLLLALMLYLYHRLLRLVLAAITLLSRLLTVVVPGLLGL
jgi:hypothetical protein